MASELFDRLFMEAQQREFNHLQECRRVWGGLQLTDIVACTRLATDLTELGEDFADEVEKIALRNRMRIRKTCADCGSPFCQGAYADQLPPGVMVTHISGGLAAMLKKLLNKFGH